MTDLVVLVISMLTLGQIALCSTFLVTRIAQAALYLPLIIFFLANGIIALGPLVFILFSPWNTLYIALIFPAWLLLAPMLWLYVEGLTSSTPWHFKSSHFLQFIPFALGLMLSALIISLPLAERQAIFFKQVDIDSGFPLLVVIAIFLSIILWVIQSGYYLVRIIKRLAQYRTKLKNLFANNEHSELHWLNFLMWVIAVTWFFAFISLMSTLTVEVALFGHKVGAILLMVLVWSLAHFSLRQKPGFTGRYITDNANTEVEKAMDSTAHKKYQRSALGQEQAQRIADKINRAMRQDKLHLEPSLSLHILAKHLAISPNYISQTLNETMKTTFFDFVNKWRIETAKPKIIANQESVLTIALEVGFDARSSFYKAFKKETSKTPSEFRKYHLAQLL